MALYPNPDGRTVASTGEVSTRYTLMDSAAGPGLTAGVTSATGVTDMATKARPAAGRLRPDGPDGPPVSLSLITEHSQGCYIGVLRGRMFPF